MSEKQTKGIGKGTPGPGRKAGIPNKTTTLLKEAILTAASDVGEDGEGKEGLVGYLRVLARSEPKAFSSLLGKVLPMQVANADGEAFRTDNVWRLELVRAEPPAA